MKLINKTGNGQLSFCKCCDTYQLEFGNILFSVPQKGLNDLKEYVNAIDGEDYTRKNSHFSSNRKIFLQFSTKGITFCLNKEELEELKELLSLKKKSVLYCSKQLTGITISLN